MNVEQKLSEKYGLSIPAPPNPGGVYSIARRVGNLVYLSGQTCTVDGRLKYSGVVGKDISIEQGIDAARQCALNLLSALKAFLTGDWSRVKQVVQLVGYVRSANGFTKQPEVINGASQLFVDVFGDAGLASRVAIGTNELPDGSPVEVMIIVEVSG